MSTTTLDERLTEAATGTLELFSVYLGTRLGLYRTLDERGRLTAPELAEVAGIHPRYAREWLEQQAVAGVLVVDEVTRLPGRRRYRLPADHASTAWPDQSTRWPPAARPSPKAAA